MRGLEGSGSSSACCLTRFLFFWVEFDDESDWDWLSSLAFNDEASLVYSEELERSNGRLCTGMLKSENVYGGELRGELLLELREGWFCLLCSSMRAISASMAAISSSNSTSSKMSSNSEPESLEFCFDFLLPSALDNGSELFVNV